MRCDFRVQQVGNARAEVIQERVRDRHDDERQQSLGDQTANDGSRFVKLNLAPRQFAIVA